MNSQATAPAQPPRYSDYGDADTNRTETLKLDVSPSTAPQHRAGVA